MTTILVTALLSSVFTAVLLVLLSYFVLAPKVRDYLEDKVLPEAQDRVRDGVTEGIEGLLPSISGKVKDGLTEALVDAANGGLASRAPAKIAGDVEKLIGSVFGRK